MVKFVLIVSLVIPNLCESYDIDSGYRTLKNYYEEKHRNIYGISILDRHRDLGHIEVHHLYSDSTNSSSYTNDHRTIAAVKTFKPAKKKPKVNVRKLLFPYRRPNVILKYIDRLRSKMEIDYDIEILMVHDIKRLGGGWQYGPQNKTTIHLKKPLYVVKRTKRDAPRIDFNLFGIAHKADLAKADSTIPSSKFKARDDRNIAAHQNQNKILIPTLLRSQSLECQYCYAYLHRPAIKDNLLQDLEKNCCYAIR